ncbi:ABC transporter ATP-binding protein [Marinivivus vitaminiproducens]|uniref:ABC transporter ATP-binding protein n=1 Tax=Marinivivus vitaminiproducens TaxID=3035935 RepID=UPI003FA1728F
MLETSVAARSEPATAAYEAVAEFTDVSKSYGTGSVRFTALQNITCRLPRARTSYVFGPSGSGKTTFLNMLGVIDRPDSGSVRIMGVDVGALSDAKAADFRARHIGYIFQSFNLIPVLSARENVEYVLLRSPLKAAERRDRAEHYLKAVGLGDNGLMNRRPGGLSGGQRQRVAIARALAGQPDLVIADEPTANLDSRTSREIVDLMGTMQEDFEISFVMCTHDITLIPASATIIEIVDGQITNTEKL